jgi:hypothetical protein
MFIRNTVFILGPVQCWHYGFVTGDGLVKKIEAAYFAKSRAICACIPTKPWDPCEMILGESPSR